MLKSEPSKDAYKKGTGVSRRYSEWRLKIEDFFESEKYFLPAIIRPGVSILDIGGAAGGFGNAIAKNIEPKIDYTCIDPNKEYMDFGKSHFQNFNFIESFFPENVPERKYDLVTMLALFPQLPDWKTALLDMAKYSNKYLLFTMLAKLNGTTVVDKDISYFYYFDSGERVHQVIHNIYEFVNFCSINEMRAKKISFYGYHVPDSGPHNRCVPNDQQIRGAAMIELFEENEYPGRVTSGGASEEFLKKHNIKTFSPEIEIIIDKKPFHLRS